MSDPARPAARALVWRAAATALTLIHCELLQIQTERDSSSDPKVESEVLSPDPNIAPPADPRNDDAVVPEPTPPEEMPLERVPESEPAPVLENEPVADAGSEEPPSREDAENEDEDEDETGSSTFDAGTKPLASEGGGDAGTCSLLEARTGRCNELDDCGGLDLQIDPNHCGQCGNVCSHPNAVSFCHAGECQLGSCDLGFVDVDGMPENGCECLKAAREDCDGVDNTCDNLVDVELTPTGLRSVCECDFDELDPGVLRSTDTDTRHPGCTTGLCAAESGSVNGLMRMDFCCARDGAFSQCVLRGEGLTTTGRPELDPGYDLSQFDADAGSSGLLEIVIRLDRRIQNVGLSLWYGQYPRRKKLRLLTAEETVGGVGPQTMVFYFRPEDAECPQYQPGDLSDRAFIGFPAECAGLADAQGIVCARGQWQSLGASCRFDYSESWLYLTAESCGATVRASATLISVRRFDDPKACACQDDDDCRDPSPYCQADALDQNGICSPASTSCAGEGLPCTTTVEGRQCNSVVVCVSGQPVCRAACG